MRESYKEKGRAWLLQHQVIGDRIEGIDTALMRGILNSGYTNGMMQQKRCSWMCSGSGVISIVAGVGSGGGGGGGGHFFSLSLMVSGFFPSSPFPKKQSVLNNKYSQIK